MKNQKSLKDDSVQNLNSEDILGSGFENLKSGEVPARNLHQIFILCNVIPNRKTKNLDSERKRKDILSGMMQMSYAGGRKTAVFAVVTMLHPERGL